MYKSAFSPSCSHAPVSVHPSPSDQHLFSLKCKTVHPDFFLTEVTKIKDSFIITAC